MNNNRKTHRDHHVSSAFLLILTIIFKIFFKILSLDFGWQLLCRLKSSPSFHVRVVFQPNKTNHCTAENTTKGGECCWKILQNLKAGLLGSDWGSDWLIVILSLCCLCWFEVLRNQCRALVWASQGWQVELNVKMRTFLYLPDVQSPNCLSGYFLVLIFHFTQ